MVRACFVAFVLLVPGAATAERDRAFGAPARELRLGLALPEQNATRPCGGLCGLSIGSTVTATFFVQNLSKRSVTIAWEHSCSGHELELVIRRPGATDAASRVGFGRSRSCRANAPVYRTLAAGATERVPLPFTVPRLAPAIYELTARAVIVPERGKGIRLVSAAVKRPIHP